MLRNLVILVLFFIPVHLRAQVFPVEGKEVSYRLIGFSFPAEKNSKEYKLEIAAGKITSADSFAGNAAVAVKGESNRIIAEVPSFGTYYTWRVVYGGKGKKTSPLYHFSTAINPGVDTAKTRLRILQSSQTKLDEFVMVEDFGVIYDMQGNPVWSLPDTLFPGGHLYSFNVTPKGTMTFFNKKTGTEVTYNGDTLWRMPNHDSICKKVPGTYHHEFVRLPNGHHMVLGVEDLKCEFEATGDGRKIKTTQPNPGYRRNVGSGGNRSIGTFGTVLEFDEGGNLVWSWKSSEYLLNSDFAYYTPLDTNKKFTAQATAFYFDEQKSALYVGFRDLSRIVKIAYPSGNVVAVYGEPFKKDVPQKGNGIFCNPHTINRTLDGDLCVYSNNTCYDTGFMPSVVVLHEPATEAEGLKKVWDFTIPPSLSVAMGIPESGSAAELADRSFAVCVGKPEYSRFFVVGRDKKILWSAKPERYDPDTKRFINPEQYRTTIISRKEMEQMIWAAQETPAP